MKKCVENFANDAKTWLESKKSLIIKNIYWQQKSTLQNQRVPEVAAVKLNHYNSYHPRRNEREIMQNIHRFKISQPQIAGRIWNLGSKWGKIRGQKKLFSRKKYWVTTVRKRDGTLLIIFGLPKILSAIRIQSKKKRVFSSAKCKNSRKFFPHLFLCGQYYLFSLLFSRNAVFER